ncbi:MAG: chemotaxis response regulator protein-glutamate methylesterase [Nitrospirota bacterium]|nr:chemotaxis response regulator protein-glutamate methylesterase [Nitrospirota bacterium]
MNSIRVLVIDDSAFMRTVICQMLAGAPDIRVVGQATNGKEGLRMAKELKPDVITLDVEMPVLGGLEMLTILMRTNPTPVIMLSSLTQEGAEVTVKALQLGAVDYLPKNNSGGAMGMRRIAPQLIDKVRAVGTGETSRAITESRQAMREFVDPSGAPRRTAERLSRPGDIPVVAIGCSTGGPAALCEVIPHLPEELGAAVVISQHMSATFTRALAERLDRLSPTFTVREAVDGDRLEPGVAIVAKGGRHLTIDCMQDGSLICRLASTPEMPTQPSVDLLFESLARACPERTLGVVLTGMGSDGASGAHKLVERGGGLITQAQTGCLVYGMPRAVVATGVASNVAPLGRIAKEIYLWSRTQRDLIAASRTIPGATSRITPRVTPRVTPRG